MVAVAIVAVLLGTGIGLWRRHERFRRRAAELRVAAISFRHPTYRDDVLDLTAADRLDRWAEQYERAARYPWLREPPIPPEPE